jgi:hypothetical protein
MIKHISLPQLSAAGTVSSDAPVSGELVGLFIASNSAGTVTVASTVPAANLLYVAGAGTAWYYPVAQNCDVGGTAVSGQYVRVPLDNYVTAGVNAAGTVNVTVAVEV